MGGMSWTPPNGPFFCNIQGGVGALFFASLGDPFSLYASCGAPLFLEAAHDLTSIIGIIRTCRKFLDPKPLSTARPIIWHTHPQNRTEQAKTKQTARFTPKLSQPITSLT